MDYLVDFTLTVPEGTPAFEVEQRSTGEATRVAELAVGLYRAADDAELQMILESLPLRPWMEISVTALAEHPNDPALSGAPPS
jgi:muconolactone D-isomerase